MSDNIEVEIPDVVDAAPEVDELTMLQERATRLGLKFRSNLGKEKLRALIQAKLDGTSDAAEEEEVAEVVEKKETPAQMRVRLKKECLALVRIRLTNMNPNKKDWPGEVLTVSNSFISAKKYVPYQDAEDGYHVPKIILEMMKSRKCQVFTKKKSVNGVPIVEGKLINEFAIEELPPLTPAELKDLAQKQAMSGSIG